MENRMINFDSSDLEGMRKLMDEYGCSEVPFAGTNEEMEDILISICKERIDVVTYQNNGWIRKNIYWRDGTCEELYEGKWNKQN